MAIKVKPLAQVADKWADVTPGRSSYYEAGATVAGADWEKNAGAAKTAYKAAVTAANIDSLFAGGIKKAGASKYERKVKDVGVARFGPGVTAAKTDFSDGVGPMLDEISKVTLAARQPRGSDANYARVAAIGAALHKKRLALRAAGA
jgi:hypothetical protein